MIKVGTDCSGIEAPIEAILKICNKYDLSYEHEFSSEISEYAEEYIKNNHNPKILFNDMTKRKSKDIPVSIIYSTRITCLFFILIEKSFISTTLPVEFFPS